jgi:hypothetical protein
MPERIKVPLLTANLHGWPESSAKAQQTPSRSVASCQTFWALDARSHTGVVSVVGIEDPHGEPRTNKKRRELNKFTPQWIDK